VLSDDDCLLDCTDDATWPAAWRSFEDQVLTLTNQRRAAGATCGGTPYPAVGPLSPDPLLRIAARCHSLDMAENDFFSHTGSDGSEVNDRATATGYDWSMVGENIAVGYPTPADVVAVWMSSGGHCTNIMRAGFTELGVGYLVMSPSDWTHYWTQVFATPD
jgi:uncharacterized protein YkwD